MIALWLVAILAGIVVAVLLVPVRIELELEFPTEGETGAWARARVRWAFLAWRSGSRVAPEPRPVPTPAAADRETRRRSGRSGGRVLLAMLRTPGFARRGWRAVTQTGRALAPESATVRARVGFDDPAPTGMLMGALATLSAVPRPARWDIQVTPDFSEPIVAGWAQVRWSLTPASVLWPLVSFACAPVTWRAARAGWGSRRFRARSARRTPTSVPR